MAAYWILFAIWAMGAIQFSRHRYYPYNKPLFVVAAAMTAVMVGLRYSVGGDWGNYLAMYKAILFQPLLPALGQSDPGYALLNWIASRNDWGMWFVNLICGILFMAGVARLAWRQPNAWLAILIAVPYLIIVVAMGYTRQAAAIGIICWAIADASPKRLFHLVVMIGLAALFHKTAILFLPILLAPVFIRNPLSAIIGAVAFAILANVFLGGSSVTLITNYVSSTYDSEGAGIRVAMNVVAAVLFLVFREEMKLDNFLKRFWTICSILALVSVVALYGFSASSGVDRISLFLIPLQIITFSRLPYTLSKTNLPVPSIFIGVISYSFLVQFVWLNYATNAVSWIPYRNFLFTDQTQ